MKYYEAITHELDIYELIIRSQEKLCIKIFQPYYFKRYGRLFNKKRILYHGLKRTENTKMLLD